MHRIVMGVFAALLPCAALAQGCFGAGQALFHCTVKGGARAVDICLQGDVGLYRYGPPGGAAEMLLARKVADMHMRPWSGVGSSIYEEIGMRNADISYVVHYTVGRIAAEVPDVSGGVMVMRADQVLATLDCDAGSVEVNDFYPVEQAKEAAGQCWSRETFDWGPC